MKSSSTSSRRSSSTRAPPTTTTQQKQQKQQHFYYCHCPSSSPSTPPPPPPLVFLNDALDTKIEHIGARIAREKAQKNGKTKGEEELEAAAAIAIPAIPVCSETVQHPIFIFDATLRRIVQEMNTNLWADHHHCFTLRRESQFTWTIMGSLCPDYVMITLDGSSAYSFFEVASPLRASARIMWYFSNLDIKTDIENAFRALYVC